MRQVSQARRETDQRPRRRFDLRRSDSPMCRSMALRYRPRHARPTPAERRDDESDAHSACLAVYWLETTGAHILHYSVHVEDEQMRIVPGTYRRRITVKGAHRQGRRLLAKYQHESSMSGFAPA